MSKKDKKDKEKKGFFGAIKKGKDPEYNKALDDLQEQPKPGEATDEEDTNKTPSDEQVNNSDNGDDVNNNTSNDKPNDDSSSIQEKTEENEWIKEQILSIKSKVEYLPTDVENNISIILKKYFKLNNSLNNIKKTAENLRQEINNTKNGYDEEIEQLNGQITGLNKHIEEKETELQKTNNDLDEVKNLYQIRHNEYQNLKRRAAEEKEKISSKATADFAEKILPLIDNLERTLEQKSTNDESNQILEGIKMIYECSIKILEDMNIKEIPTEVGDHQDPELHHTIESREEEGFEPGTIIQIIQKGYAIYDDSDEYKVIRPATVITAKEPENEVTEEEEKNSNESNPQDQESETTIDVNPEETESEEDPQSKEPEKEVDKEHNPQDK